MLLKTLPPDAPIQLMSITNFFQAVQLLNCCQLLSGDRQQIGRDNRGKHVAFERTKAFPGAPGQAETAFEPGYARFDTGAELPKLFVNIVTATHVDLFKTSLFGKANIFDAFCFGNL